MEARRNPRSTCSPTSMAVPCCGWSLPTSTTLPSSPSPSVRAVGTVRCSSCTTASLVVEQAVEHEDMDYDTALEWHEFNTFCAYLGPGTPVFV